MGASTKKCHTQRETNPEFIFCFKFEPGPYSIIKRDPVTVNLQGGAVVEQIIGMKMECILVAKGPRHCPVNCLPWVEPFFKSDPGGFSDNDSQSQSLFI